MPQPDLAAPRPAARRRGTASVLAVMAAVVGAWALPAAAQGAAPPPPASSPVCRELAEYEPPGLPAARRALLQWMQRSLAECSHDAGFLALLGHLWWQEGEPGEALIWLERALLLDPSHAAARADHALVLASLGEPLALQQLQQQWQGRTDLPAEPRRRIAEATRPLQAGSLPWTLRPEPARGPGPLSAAPAPARGPRWLHGAELGLLAGHESNLDRSPTLDSLTLTSPDGVIELPLVQPLRPQFGAAWLGEAAWRSAWDSGQGSLVQASLAAAGRGAPAHDRTDWHFLQAGVEAWRQWGALRLQALAHQGRVGGALNEAYRVGRWGLAAELDRPRLTWRLALDAERRHQSLSTYADARLTQLSLGVQSPSPLDERARWGLQLRAARDEAPDPTRPGGDQRQRGLTLRYTQPWGVWRLDGSLRWQHTRDAEGYSPLLVNNARREARQTSGLLELTHPLGSAAAQAPGWKADWVGQWQWSRQTSNIVVFEHQSDALYAGLRLRW